MSEIKFTDEEIKKALECCYTAGIDCKDCPLYDFDECNNVLMDKYVKDLINRQNAEIERLSEENKVLSRYEDYIKAEAIKEFAERLKRNEGRRGVPIATIDNLVKEMVGDAEC